MYPAKFAYVAPKSIDEALTLLEHGNGEAKLMAGGHSLLPLMKLRLAQPATLIDIARIPGLGFIEPAADGSAVRIGATVTYRQVQLSDVVKAHLPVVAETMSLVGDQQVRARGTLVGGLAHADPSGDMPAVVLALGATLVARGLQGSREIDVDEFFVDMLTTSLAENELITEVRIRKPGPRSGAAYLKFDQPASHYALTGVCAVITLSEDGKTISAARLGITGVGPKAYRPMRVEAALLGVDPTDEKPVEAASAGAAEGVDVQGDIHASPPYRAHLARVFTRRAVLEAARRATA
ncbi:MAG: xanthine dehydrogenase family protein subunit M [Chloroflexi bacterium]|nr:xanthine dehydrogenase family protein subunit M [Chloroflexota bacterium]